MWRRIRIEFVDAYYLVVGSRRKILPIAGESHRVYGARMVAHRGQLPGLIVLWIRRIVDGIGRPYAHEAI